ncbi:MAG: hypothetical protein Kow00107_01060 [Planctomycetota bacterium]
MTLLYMAGPPPFKGEMYVKIMKGRNVLVTFGQHRRSVFRDLAPFASAILDCGAWSARRGGKPVSLESYMDFIERKGDEFGWYAALDVIGDPSASMRHFERMRRHGLAPVPVFHGREPWSLLEEYRSASPLVALGSCPRMGREERLNWFSECMGRHPGRYHLFRMTDGGPLKQLRPESADSATWAIAAAHGYAPDGFGGRTRRPDLTAFERSMLWLKKFDDLQGELNRRRNGTERKREAG